LSSYTKYVEDYKPYVKLVSITATITIGCICLIYAIFYLCRNCCSRALMCIFPVFSILITLLIILPSIVFSILFVVFDDICPKLEQPIISAANSFLSIGEDKLSDLLLCPNDVPIYSLGFNQFFDINSTILDHMHEISDTMTGAFNISDLGIETSFFNFSKSLNVSDSFTNRYLIPDYETNIQNLKDQKPASTYNIINQLKDHIDGNTNQLNFASSKMQLVTEFGDQIFPRTTRSVSNIMGIVSDLVDEAGDIVYTGINNLTCSNIKCIYSPLKNALCVDFYDAISFWVLSSIFTIVSLPIMSILICNRRKGMASQKVSNLGEDSEDEALRKFADL